MKLTQSVAFLRAVRQIPAPIRRLLIRCYHLRQTYRLNNSRFPNKLTYFITNNCNLHCPFCFRERDNNAVSELSTESIMKFARSIRGMVSHVVLTGGEPFCRRDLLEVSQALVNEGGVFNLTVVTNGSFPSLTDSYCKAMGRDGLRLTFQLSLDGPQEVHDRIRGKHSYRKLMDTAAILQRELAGGGVSGVTIVSMLTKETIGNLEWLVEKVTELGFHHEFNIVRSADRSSSVPPDQQQDHTPRSSNGYLTADEISAVVSKVLGLFSEREVSLMERATRLKFHYIDRFHREGTTGLRCSAGRREVVLYADGSVSVCELMKPIGSILDSGCDFKLLWQGREVDEVLKRVEGCSCAHDCAIINSIPYSLEALERLFG